MEHRSRSNDAAVKDAQAKSSKEEYVGGTVHIAMHKMNLLHLDQNLRRLLQLKPQAIIELRELPAGGRKEAAFLKR